MLVPGIPFIKGRNSSVDRDGRKFGIAIHNTSNDASARNEALYAARREDAVSGHFYVDDIEIFQSLDTSVVSWHAGSDHGNQNAISVEITGVNSWTEAEWHSNVAWDALGAMLAVLCIEYGIPVTRCSVDQMVANPKVMGFYSHDDMRQAWGGTSHTDPGPNFPWARLFGVTQDAIDAIIGVPEEDEMTKPVYHGRILVGETKHPIVLALNGGIRYTKAWVSFAADEEFDLRLASRNVGGWFDITRVFGRALTAIADTEISFTGDRDLVSVSWWPQGADIDAEPLPFPVSVGYVIRYE